mmetsp:Transcript_50847/g.80596  ORF Transcript_50847/g.80596 Transcript_50847/m.80596 type:complete len:210 (+) Transcript_50847:80-709(+)
MLGYLLILVELTYAAAQKHLVSCDTSKGPLEFDIIQSWSPKGVARFLDLVRAGYYTDIPLHRAIEKWALVFGINTDEKMRKTWNQTIEDDPKHGVPFEHGTLSFGAGGANRRSVQLFISYTTNPGFGRYPWETPIGHVSTATRKVLDSIYTGYGENDPHGLGPNPELIEQNGNAWVRENYPKLDFIHSCQVASDPEVVESPPPDPPREL